jgi:hypothetical protein
MAFRTFGDLRTQVEKELDLEDETFIQASEMIGFWNRGIAIAESHLITLGLKDKYFLGRERMSIVQGQEEYDLPASLYGNKIIKIIYHVGSTFYTLMPLESKDMFENYEYLNTFSTTDYYRYLITHTTPGSQKLLLVPKAISSESNALTFWFSRSANRYTVDADICDFPAIAYEFLAAFVKEKCYEKESHVNFEGAKADRMEKEQLMQSVLAGQISDSELSKLEADLSSYQESS